MIFKKETLITNVMKLLFNASIIFKESSFLADRDDILSVEI